jgi:phosphopentomutase
MPRACVIVLDAVGVGELPDAAAYGDAGSSTLANVAEAVGGLALPNLQELGLGNVMPLRGCPPADAPPSVVGRLTTRSAGKDTTIGHWELMGIVTPEPMPTYPDGFPPDVVEAFAEATGRGVLGNVPASGTEIIQRFGDEHVRTGKWILYTSADSVFQIAAHEEVVPLDELYAACRTAREQLTGPHAVGRVIARPFVGTSGAYTRTANRHDFSLAPPRPNHLARLRAAGHQVHGVGKIADVFAGQDVDTSAPTASNAEGIEQILRLLGEVDDGLIFANLVETDMIYGHRNDPAGFHGSLREFDRSVPDLRAALRPDDLLVLCSDHGCDPTTPSTDHSREYALLVAHTPGGVAHPGGRHDGDLADVGATVRSWLGDRGAGGDAEVPGALIPLGG